MRPFAQTDCMRNLVEPQVWSDQLTWSNGSTHNKTLKREQCSPFSLSLLFSRQPLPRWIFRLSSVLFTCLIWRENDAKPSDNKLWLISFDLVKFGRGLSSWELGHGFGLKVFELWICVWDYVSVVYERSTLICGCWMGWIWSFLGLGLGWNSRTFARKAQAIP